MIQSGIKYFSASILFFGKKSDAKLHLTKLCQRQNLCHIQPSMIMPYLFKICSVEHNQWKLKLASILHNRYANYLIGSDVSILIKISHKFVPKVGINNIPALVQIMAWHRPGDKPLSEPMMVSLLMLDPLQQPLDTTYLNKAQVNSTFSIDGIYRKTSSISRTKSQNLNVSCLLLQWSLPNPLKQGVKLRMKM